MACFRKAVWDTATTLVAVCVCVCVLLKSSTRCGHLRTSPTTIGLQLVCVISLGQPATCFLHYRLSALDRQTDRDGTFNIKLTIKYDITTDMSLDPQTSDPLHTVLQKSRNFIHVTLSVLVAICGKP